MESESEIEIREYDPIEIERCEIIMPMPLAWVDFVRLHGLDLAPLIGGVVSMGGGIVHEAKLRGNFQSLYYRLHRSLLPPADALMRFAIRRDILRCLEAAAKLVGESPHEVALRILAGQMPLAAGRHLPKYRHPRKKRPANIVTFRPDPGNR